MTLARILNTQQQQQQHKKTKKDEHLTRPCHTGHTREGRRERERGSAAALGEKEKKSDFKKRAEKIEHDFVAIAFDSLGYTRPNGEILAY